MPMIFEAIMLICFGLAWPFSIYRMYKTKKSAGKSTFFLSIILLGYIAGMAFKYTGNFDFIFYLYMLNCGMVSLDLFLVLEYRKNG